MHVISPISSFTLGPLAIIDPWVEASPTELHRFLTRACHLLTDVSLAWTCSGVRTTFPPGNVSGGSDAGIVEQTTSSGTNV